MTTEHGQHFTSINRFAEDNAAERQRVQRNARRRAARAEQRQRPADELPERDFYEGDSPDY
jgi:hypothetical protein